MSEDAFKSFLAATKQDPALAAGAQQAMGGGGDDAAAAALAAFARARGYDVGDGDVAAAMRAAPPSDGPLPDDRLDGVAGGWSSPFGYHFWD